LILYITENVSVIVADTNQKYKIRCTKKGGDILLLQLKNTIGINKLIIIGII